MLLVKKIHRNDFANHESRGRGKTDLSFEFVSGRHLARASVVLVI